MSICASNLIHFQHHGEFTARVYTFVFFSRSSEDGEKKDHDKSRDEAPHRSLVEEKKALKKRLGQRKEPPEAFMASFLAGLEIYQTKTLVSQDCL